MRILMVKDEKYMARAVAEVLKKNHYTVDLAHDGQYDRRELINRLGGDLTAESIENEWTVFTFTLDETAAAHL